MPLLRDPGQLPVAQYMHAVSAAAAKPKAIVIVSANWEEEHVSILRPSPSDLLSAKPAQHHSTAPDRMLAVRISGFLSNAGIEHRRVVKRGFDHGVLMPLKILFPNDYTPCVDPAQHIEIGKALCQLRSENIMIIGAGMSFRNMQAMRDPDSRTAAASFNEWLVDTCCSNEFTLDQREQRLCKWTQAPYARYCHPREEHLMPLHVCMGMTQGAAKPAKLLFNDTAIGASASGMLWQ